MRRTLAASALLLAACVSSNAAEPDVMGGAVVDYVIDGDTVDVVIDGHDERVRLIGVDTPESVHPNVAPECFGAEASAYLRELLPEGTAVRLERDAEARDRYGRLLAYVYRVGDGLLVNLALIEAGYGDAVTFGDNEALLDLFRIAEVRARTAGLGLWGACGGPDTPAG
jgi:micrococcal nuclease